MSKSSTNVVTISGTLDATPEFDTLHSGTRRARFVIDTVEQRGRRRIHNYPHFAVYGEQAKELEAKGLSKGDAIEAEGRLRTGQSNVIVEEETIRYKKTQEPVKWDTTWINVVRVKTDDLDGSDTNVVKISGTLDTELDFEPTRRGTPRARFVVDMVEFRGQEEIHHSPKVTVYDREMLAELESKGLSKGDAIEVEGQLQTRLSTVIVDGEKVVYKKTQKPVRRKIAWITAERVVEVDLDARGETSVGASGDQPETASASERQPKAEDAVEPERGNAQPGSRGPEGHAPAEVEEGEVRREAEAAEEPTREGDEAENTSAGGGSTEPAEAEASPGEEPEAEIQATRAAKKMARLNDIDIATVKGTGYRGKIVTEDVEEAIEMRDNAGGGNGAQEAATESTASESAAIQDPPSEAASQASDPEPSEDDELLEGAEELGMDLSGAQGAGQFPQGFGDE